MQELTGLTHAEAALRLQKFGPNEVSREKPASALLLFLAQFRSPLVWLLLAACGLAAFLGEVGDAVAIGAILILNAIVGFFQEYRAERAIQALRAMTAPHARVIREGQLLEITAAAIVPGDCLVLDAGDLVAADGLLIEAQALKINEAALTGESLPALKNTDALAETAPLAERTNRVFMGTAVVNGSAKVQIEKTGMQTELGKIAHLLANTVDSVSPLQIRLAKVSKSLMILCLSIVALVALLGLLRGESLLTLLISSVSLAVAAVPEGLPAIVTIALALGVQRMVHRHVLVRRLPSVETLGCTTVICTDKTGTLTAGVMKVRELFGSDEIALLEAAVACCDAEPNAEGEGWLGDPTEIAILEAAAARGISRADLEQSRPRRQLNPFDSERKRMSIWRADGVLYVKGAFESLLPLCNGSADAALAEQERMAAHGLRVLAVAVGSSCEERELKFLGLLGLADPPRPEAIAAIAKARSAGIRTVMITGDHPSTARAIARELGLWQEGEPLETLVHARATPSDKLEIVRAWKGKGAIVAMTGDGVNDAPALKEAHIGIAMGMTGTEVTREAADMILTDDRFDSIVAAIREGRGIYENIRKTLTYLLAGNASELGVMLIAALLGLPLPLLPMHLLWINLVTDGLPALALVVDPPDPDAMERPPRDPDEPMLGKAQWRHILLVGFLESILVLVTFVCALNHGSLEHARTMAFSVLVFCELLRAFSARHPKRLFWQLGVFSNFSLLFVVGLSIALQIGIHQFGFTRNFFRIEALTWLDFLTCFALGFIPVSLFELGKILGRNKERI